MAQRLDFNEKGQLRILQLTDLHYYAGGRENRRTLGDIRNILNWERPDLVVYTGDFITCRDSGERVRDIFAPVEESGTPFLYVFGNHDAEFGAGHRVLAREIARLSQCLNPPTARGIPGHSNFMLELGIPGRPADFLLMGLDSHMYNKDRAIGLYDHIKPAQIAWYARQIKRRKRENAEFGALCFLHIPLQEYAQALARPGRVGSLNEGICSPAQNSGLFSMMLDLGHTRGVFCGHDHINDACGLLKGIALCYGRGGGHSTYGKRGFKKGARLIQLYAGQPRRFDSWVRLNDGSVTGHFICDGEALQPVDAGADAGR